MTAQPNSSIAKNRQAGFDFEILETLEAGLILTGPEVKSIRAGHVNIKGAYINFEQDRPYLKKCHISPYAQASGHQKGYEPERHRPLLLNQKEIKTLLHQIKTNGVTLIPLEIYLKKGKIKLKMAIAKGKKNYDKRATIKEKAQNREINRTLRRY